MSPEGKDKKTVRSPEIGKTYTMPELYDIAFDFRDVPAQVDFLLEIAQKYLGRKVKSAMEFACGPGYHTREMARRKLIADGLDLEPKMVAYTRNLIKKEKLSAQIIEGDMRYYRSANKYDFVYNLMASFAQLQTNEDIMANFHCAADLLNDNGVYIISTAHPRDFYGDEKPTAKNIWTMTRGDITVETNWGEDNQQFDPLTEVDDILVTFTATTPDGITRYEFPDRYRRCSLMTFKALVQLSGRFEIMDMFGEFDKNLKLGNEKECWRFIPVLRKIK